MPIDDALLHLLQAIEATDGSNHSTVMEEFYKRRGTPDFVKHPAAVSIFDHFLIDLRTQGLIDKDGSITDLGRQALDEG